ncbi:hypothetical protein J8M97_09435 [Gordonia polyisoprenivorans]|uniref:hypothetical protein n=1 Tax=Gordonia polyisoprenivorans TaxID=84595 RepID=UPI001B8B07C5|nr:hypothetical protein [Gordonia polyisoprenivorans]QUD84767.1 hypothetical protein J8M97_09435 [Gordonia polyisoprenivorans]
MIENQSSVEQMILDALQSYPEGEMVPWARIRDTLPPGFWLRLTALGALVERGEIETVKVRGRNYIARADSFSRAAYRAAGSSALVLA